MTYWTRDVERALTPAEATELVGLGVQEHEPTVDAATVGRDEQTGEPVFAYLPVRDGIGELRRAVMDVNCGMSPRSSGVGNMSRTFGYAPRRPVYGREGCNTTKLAAEAPASEAVLDTWAARLQAVYAEFAPEFAARDAATVAGVRPDWKLGESDLWTSGVINRSSRLPYHRDAFNFPVWSAMPVLRRNMDGGYLVIPEYDTVIPCRDGWAVFFPGHKLVHGVTPMRPTAPDGYRYSIVYYALKGMKDCYTAAQETAYAQERRTERERDMAARLLAGEPDGHRPDGTPWDDRLTHKAQADGAHGDRLFKPRSESLRTKRSGRPFAGAEERDYVHTGDPVAIEDAAYEEDT